MFPESDLVKGPNPEINAMEREIGWEQCNQFAINVADRIINARGDVDNFYGFNIYFAPAFDNKLYQETLNIS